MDTDALALEVWLDRREAALIPELAAHDRAALAAALADRDPPPPPAMLLDPGWLELPRRAARSGDRGLTRRAATLARWSLAARVATDPAVRAAAASPRDLDGLTRRHQALAHAAGRLGVVGAAGLIDALYGAAPAEPTSLVDGEPAVEGAAVAAAAIVPELGPVLTTLAARAAIDPSAITLHRAPRPLTIVIAGGGDIHCLIGAGDDRLAALVVAVHELGHGLLAAARRGLGATVAPAASRVVDEAAAAWAVRALEDAAVVADPTARAMLAGRRARRERLTVALARFEAACLAGSSAAAVWPVVAAVDARPPSAFAALFDEPGVMAAYAAADRLAATAAARPERWRA